ncbi:hypothetical protein [Asticcacaulis solisilvae]|uniref:hypothetical protein n=1 Tax=Asticcacaulis solisilvae TaxID=1217274 RepID=UPI003FD6FDE1
MSARISVMAGLAAAVLMAASPVLAQGIYDDDDDNYRPPLAGADISHDYLRNYYYDYEGTPPRDPRVGEQEGWREGTLHTPPRGWWSRCGCGSRGYWHGRWYDRPPLYDYGERTFNRVELDHRTQYEYRWPHRDW